MAIITYKFDYDSMEAEVKFKLNNETFDPKIAQEVLNFWTWDYDDEGDPTEEFMKKLALECIRVASMNNWNRYGVIQDFKSKEGWPKIDGTYGIELENIHQYEFREELLEMSIEHPEK